MQFTAEELHEKVQLHKKWRLGQPGGVRLNLSGAYLSRAYLSDADLIGAYLSRAYLSRADLRDANLSDADLSGAYLSGADLSRADLSRADLRDADLSGADLSGAYLSRAYLSGADLRDANLSDADLSRAYLRRANLSGADLSDAYLRRANLSGADLSGADLSGAKEDFLKIINLVPAEVPALKQALIEGRIDGSVYQGECACLVGTIANVRGVNIFGPDIPDGLRPDSDRPAERLFLGIKKGHTPETNPISKIVLGWIEEWQAQQPEVTNA